MTTTTNNEIKFRITPVVERYYSAETNYGVFVFQTTDDIPEYKKVSTNAFEEYDNNVKTSTLVGNMQQLYLGSEYEVVATLSYKKEYKSYQYEAKTVTSIEPKTQEQQKKFLLSIITERQANTLLEAYPDAVNDIINNNYIDVKKLNGIGNFTFNSIKEKVMDNYVISDILILLQPLGIKFSVIKKLLMSEKNPIELKKKLLENPYLLLGFNGFSFKTVDALALKLNPELKISETRTRAFVGFFLKSTANSQGHTWVKLETLENGVRDNVPECLGIYTKLIESEKIQEKTLHILDDKVGLLLNYQLETDIYTILKSQDDYPAISLTQQDIDDGISQAENEQGFALIEEQRQEVIESLKSNVVFVCGKAGTGKTTIARSILSIYKKANYSISCCALSAKAAQRITESTGMPASTIHRMLGYDRNGFKYNSENPLEADVVYIDECSMNNLFVLYSVLSAVKRGAKIILSGDDRQLLPIGSGNAFSDLLKSKDVFNIRKLTKVLRQAEDSGVLMDANKIRDGKYPISSPELKIVNGKNKDMIYMFRENKSAINSIAIKSFLKAVETDGLDEVVIITPRKDNCENSSTEINIKIVDIIADKTKPSITFGKKTYYVGTKVMQIDNNYEKNVYNGEIGYVTDIREVTDEENKKSIEFEVNYKLGDQEKSVVYSRNELDQIDLAYAMTVHKSQGSGYKTVIIAIDNSHFALLDIYLLYTAITRAKKRCLLLAEPSAFKTCMANKGNKRQTWLSL